MATKTEKVKSEKPPMPRLAYTIDEFAEAGYFSRSHVVREIKAGRIIAIKSGKAVRIPVKFAQGYFEPAAA